jgi:hypothetical protein
VQAHQATLATRMDSNFGFVWDTLACPSAGMPTDIIFAEDFEKGAGRWTLEAPWEVIPSAGWPVSFANSGKNALDVFVPAFDPSQPVARLNSWLTPPASTTNLRIAYSQQLFVASDGGEVRVVREFGGTFPFEVTSLTKGYGNYSFPLAGPFAPGERFTIELRARSGENEWLIDDILVYECLPTVNGAPAFIAAQFQAEGTEAVITWGAPVYKAPGNAPTSYQVTYLSGSHSGEVVVPAPGLTTTLSDLTAGEVYRFTVRAIGANGVPGPSVGIYAPGDSVYTCPHVRDLCRSIFPG